MTPSDEFSVDPELTVADYRKAFRNIWVRTPTPTTTSRSRRSGPWAAWMNEHGSRAQRMEQRLCDRLESLQIQNEGLQRLVTAYQSGELASGEKVVTSSGKRDQGRKEIEMSEPGDPNQAPPGESFFPESTSFDVRVPDGKLGERSIGKFKFERNKPYDMVYRDGEWSVWAGGKKIEPITEYEGPDC